MVEREELENAIRRLESQRESLGDAAVDAALDGLHQRLSELKSPEKVNRVAAVSTKSTGERRVMTVLFCDVVGSTALAEGMDPETWTQIMNAAFEYLIEPINRYGGTVARLMGDAVLAFFGAPTAHEDDPQRAVLAGLDMIEKIRPFQQRLRVDQGVDFNVRIGINTGLAVVGDVGPESKAEYTAMGDAVNLAARMEQTAQPGTVRIAQDTYVLIAPLFECKALGAVQVKGKKEPIPTYQVLARKSKPGRLRGLAGHGINSPLIGREHEFAVAKSALNELLDGKGAILAILGEAGIGKSRLLAELRANAREYQGSGVVGSSSLDNGHSPLTWLEGDTLSYGQEISYWPFQEILRDCAGISEDDDEASAWSKLERRVGQLFPETTDEILPYLASLLALEVTDEYAGRVNYLDAEELRRQVYRSSRLFFQRLADRNPLVLVFDDLHWMDASSAGLLEHLLPLVEIVPLLLCCMSRPDPDSPAIRLRDVATREYPGRFIELILRPLSETDSNSLVQNLLQIDGLPSHIRQLMVNKADGNPLFLEEIVRDLIDAGALIHVPSTGRWQATPAAEHMSVPDTIQGLIIGRIDRLEEDLKRVLRRAAVIGRTFLYRVLEAIIREDGDLEGSLKRLERVELIQENRRIPELEYVFKHALAQEAAYDSILLQERHRLHSEVGKTIETLMAERVDEFYGLLAYHYSAAEQWDKAQEFLFKAGDQAGRMAADAEALALYRRALEAYAQVRGDEWEPLERARLERKIGAALFRLGEHEQARPYLERALALLGQGLPSSQWGMRLAIARAILTQTAHRMFPGLFISPMQDSLDEEAEEIYKASMALGGVEFLADISRYFLLALRALNTSEGRGYAYGSATLAANMGLAAVLIGSVRLADIYFRRSAEYRKQIDPPRPVPELEINISAKYNQLADFEKMRHFALQGMEIAQKAGNLRLWGLGKINLVWSYWGQALYDATLEACEELLQSAEESSDKQLATWAIFAFACTQQRRGLLEESIPYFRQAITVAEELPDWATRVGSAGWMGRSYLALGRIGDALEVMEPTKKSYLALSSNMLAYTYLGNGLAEAYLMKAQDSVGSARKAWLRKAKVECKLTLKGSRHLRMPLPEALLFRGRYEWLMDQKKSAQKWWTRALIQAQKSGMRYEEGEIHLEIGRHLGDRHHLEQAIVVLQEIKSAHLLKEARAALASLSER